MIDKAIEQVWKNSFVAFVIGTKEQINKNQDDTDEALYQLIKDKF